MRNLKGRPAAAVAFAVTLLLGAGVNAQVTQPSFLELRPAREAAAAGPTLVIDTFQHDTPFVKQSTSGVAEPDLSQVLLGTRSLRLGTDGNGLQVNLRATGLKPMDLSDAFLRLSLRVEGVAHLSNLYVYLSDDGFQTHDAYALVRYTGAPAESVLDDGVWGTLSTALGTPVTPSTVDLTQVTDVQISLVDDGTAPVNVWLGGLDAVARPERGVVTVMFDDARSGVYELALPQAHRHGVRASVAVIPDLVGVESFMTLEQLRLMERFAGWELVAHHVTPLDHGFDSLPEADLRAELEGVKSWMILNGFRRGADVIAYPHGLIDDSAIGVVRGYFAAGRTIVRGSGLETLPPADPFRIRALSVTSGDSVAYLTDAIDRAAQDKAWLVLVFHQLSPAQPEFETQYNVVDFAQVMAHLAAADVQVLTFSEAVLGR